MNTPVLLSLAALALVLFCTAWAKGFLRQRPSAFLTFAFHAPLGFLNAVRGGDTLALANIAEGTHHGSITKKTDAAIATRYLLGKFGTDVDHVAVCGASDMPLGIISDEASAAEELVAVQFLSATDKTRKCVASEAIAITDELYTAANGKVQNLPAGAGTYYKVGRPLQAAAADGDVIEFESCYPTAVVVS
jgi:hypothetical protein